MKTIGGKVSEMKKVTAIFILTLGLIASGVAQDKPQAEVFGGYSYLHTSDSGVSINSNGASGSVSFNPNPWLGLVGDFGFYHASPNVSTFTVGLPFSADVSLNTFSYLFGPKVAMRSNEKFTPFAQALFGGAHQKATVKVAGISASDSANAFAMALGGGLDVKATSSIAIRVIQAEYVLTKFNDGGNNRQNSVRISAGVVFRLGEH